MDFLFVCRNCREHCKHWTHQDLQNGKPGKLPNFWIQQPGHLQLVLCAEFSCDKCNWLPGRLWPTRTERPFLSKDSREPSRTSNFFLKTALRYYWDTVLQYFLALPRFWEFSTSNKQTQFCFKGICTMATMATHYFSVFFQRFAVSKTTLVQSVPNNKQNAQTKSHISSYQHPIAKSSTLPTKSPTCNMWIKTCQTTDKSKIRCLELQYPNHKIQIKYQTPTTSQSSNMWIITKPNKKYCVLASTPKQFRAHTMPPTTLPTKTWIKAHLSIHKLPNSPKVTNPMPKSYHFLIFLLCSPLNQNKNSASTAHLLSYRPTNGPEVYRAKKTMGNETDTEDYSIQPIQPFSGWNPYATCAGSGHFRKSCTYLKTGNEIGRTNN